MYSDGDPFASESGAVIDRESPDAQPRSPASPRRDGAHWYWSEEHRDYIRWRGLCSAQTPKANPADWFAADFGFQATNSSFTENTSGLVIPQKQSIIRPPDQLRLKAFVRVSLRLPSLL